MRTRFATLDRTEIRSRWNTAKGRAILARWKQAGFERDALESLVGKFDGHIDLRGIPLHGEKLPGANLADADLYSANLEGADLSRSDLRNSYFSEANIKGTRFDWAAMRGVYLDNVEYDTKTSFLGIDLATINFNLAALLRELEQLCVMERVEAKSGRVLCRRVPDPSPLQKQLLDTLKLTLPATVPEAKVKAVTRKKINKVRKSRVK